MAECSLRRATATAARETAMTWDIAKGAQGVSQRSNLPIEIAIVPISPWTLNRGARSSFRSCQKVWF